jgi:hypothetical protein
MWGIRVPLKDPWPWLLLEDSYYVKRKGTEGGRLGRRKRKRAEGGRRDGRKRRGRMEKGGAGAETTLGEVELADWRLGGVRVGGDELLVLDAVGEPSETNANKASLAPRKQPIQRFLGSHPSRTDWACGSLASRPYKKPNRPRLYYASLAKGQAREKNTP